MLTYFLGNSELTTSGLRLFNYIQTVRVRVLAYIPLVIENSPEICSWAELRITWPQNPHGDALLPAPHI
jgi:hypothetical protein